MDGMLYVMDQTDHLYNIQILLFKLLGYHLEFGHEASSHTLQLQTVSCGNNNTPTSFLPSNNNTNSASMMTNMAISSPDITATRWQAKCDNPKRRNNASSSSSSHHHHPPPRKMSDTINPIYFLHVGKAGGTSIDDLVLSILQCERKMYIGDLHYDWSYIQQRELPRIQSVGLRRHQHQHQHQFYDENSDNVDDDDISNDVDVITFLRHPVSRAISQFHFSKKLKWAKKANATFLHQTFDEYINDPNKEWFQPIADGESGTDFLAGIFPTEKGHWVASDRKETRRKVYLRQNKTAACLLAAQRLEATTWFGLLEDIDRSMLLLQFTLGLPTTPVLPKSNTGDSSPGHHPPQPPPSRETLRKVEKYLPKDLWLYEYATRLFEARWNYFMGNNCTYVPPELPSLSSLE